MEFTVVILKPDALERGLHFPILRRIEQRKLGKQATQAGLCLVDILMTRLEPQDVDFLYSHQADQPFYAAMKEYLTRGPVIIAVFAGTNAVAIVRGEIGGYDKSVPHLVPVSFEDGERLAIRSFYAEMDTPNYVNLIHASSTHAEWEQERKWFLLRPW